MNCLARNSVNCGNRFMYAGGDRWIILLLLYKVLTGELAVELLLVWCELDVE